MANKKGVLGIFPYLDDLLAALEALKKDGWKVHTVFSPVPRPEIQEALGIKPSPVRYFTLIGGITGSITGFSLACYSNLKWSLITSGKPVLAWIPFVVIGFEFTILFGVLATIVGWLLQARLPRFRFPSHYDPRFSEDRFGILVFGEGGEVAVIKELYCKAGAESVVETND